MKKVLWIACLLCLMPFLGYTQQRAGLAKQDIEAALGQAPVSKELPASIHLEGISKGDRSNTWVAHGMFVPPQNYNFGRYYTIDADGTVTQVKMYNDWYFSSAEYCSATNWMAQSNPTDSVWGYANDYTVGWSRIDYNTGKDYSVYGGIANGMNDLAFDYHGGRMLGTKDGYIYKISPLGTGAVEEVLYDYTEHNNIVPITLACDLDGSVYFVDLSQNNADSKLYKLTWNNAGVMTMTDLGAVIDTATNTGWQAMRIQTMAFDHASGKLYWWQCKNGNNGFANFVELLRDETTGEFDGRYSVKNANPLSTSLSGLFFKFDYVENWAHCIDVNNKLKIGNVRDKKFFPGQDVTVTVSSLTCSSFDTLYVMESADHSNVIYKFATLPSNKKITFPMPTFDVDIDVLWKGDEYTVTVGVTGGPGGQALLIPDLPPVPNQNNKYTAGCNDVVEITYLRPEGYVLKSITAKKGSTNVTLSFDADTAYFTMPAGNVNVAAKYIPVTVDNIDDICQYNHITTPEHHYPANETLTGYTIKYMVGKVPATGGSPATYTEFADAAALNAYLFAEAGDYEFYMLFNHNQWGAFITGRQNFTVNPAPAVVELIVTDSTTNRCVSGDLPLAVSDTTLTGEFTWMKGNTVLDVTQVPTYTYNGAQGNGLEVSDAGYYKVIYTPANLQACQLESDSIPVNVATLPNKPVISQVGGNNGICYNGSATLVWNHGVLNPEEYEYKWYMWNATTYDWDLLDDQTENEITVDSLTTDSYFRLVINYAGEYYLCESEPSDWITVVVNPQEPVDFGNSDTETCAGFAPTILPTVYNLNCTDIVWLWDSLVLNETTNVLHLGDPSVYPNPSVNILREVGDHEITFMATSENGCEIEGTMTLTIKPLPELEVNYVTQAGDTLTATRDNPLVLPVCYGDIVELFATGADDYDWGLVNQQPSASVYTIDQYQYEVGGGMGDWTVIHNGNTDYSWTTDPDQDWQGNWYPQQVHSGTKSAMSASYMTSCYTADEYLVSPQVTLSAGAELTFWAKNYGSDQDTLFVYVSEAGNTNVADFTLVPGTKFVPSKWNWEQMPTVDLSAYAGKNVYIALRHSAYCRYCLYVDDIEINTGTEIITQNFDPEIVTIGTIQIQATVDENWQAEGINYTTGCTNTATVLLQVNPLPTVQWINPAPPAVVGDTLEISVMIDEIQLEATPAGGVFTYIDNVNNPWQSWPINDGILRPAEFDLGTYQLIYSFQDTVAGCVSEERINIKIVKPYWTDYGIRDTNWFANCVNHGRFEITNPYQMGAFAAYLNYYALDAEDQQGINYYNFDGDTVYITNNINLLEEDYFFRPLSDFTGVLDGTGKVIDSMVILEDYLWMEFNGTWRNIGFHDAKITNLDPWNNNYVASIDIYGTMHNAYFTQPVLNNVEFNLNPEGDVQNVYYYGPQGDQTVSLYLNQDYAGEFANNQLSYSQFLANASYKYSLTQNIYTRNELNLPAGTYYSIQFESSNWETYSRDWTIYLSNTTEDYYSYPISIIEMTDADKVFEGTVEYPGRYGWFTLPLDTPFVYDGTSNIVLTVVDNTGVANGYAGFYCSYTNSYNYGIVYSYNNNSEYDASNIDYGTHSYYRSYYHPNFRMGYPSHIEVTPAELYDGTDGLLSDWVWLKNDFSYREWIQDLGGANYGYPVMQYSFEHHHYVTVLDFADGTYELAGDVDTTTVYGTKYSYAMNGDEVIVNVTPDPYVIVDSIIATALNYRGINDSVLDWTGTNNSFSFIMPQDSLYDVAYNVEVEIRYHKDYWTDDFNYDTTWFKTCYAAGKYEIKDAEDLAAFAHTVLYGNDNVPGFTGPYNFYNDTIRFTGGAQVINMDAHLWKPVEGFSGVLDGRGHIVQNLVIREDVSGMFLDVYGNYLVRNLGIQDIDMPDGSAVFGTSTTYGYAGEIHNSYVVNNPTSDYDYEIASYYTVYYDRVKNCYTLSENGGMIDVYGDPISMTALNNWVHAEQQQAQDPYATAYMDWVKDLGVINYGYPIHGDVYIPGYPIYYYPEVNYPVDGYVSGHTTANPNVTAHEANPGETVVVESYPALGFNLSELTVWYEIPDSTVNIKDTKTFEMIESPAYVNALFAPIEWTLTLNYVHREDNSPVLDGNNQPYIVSYTLHYGDPINEQSPDEPGYTPDSLWYRATMPNGHLTDTIFYDANYYHIALDPNNSNGVAAMSTIPVGDSAQYNSIATVVLTPEAGWTINDVYALDTCNNLIVPATLVPNTVATWTFTMPMCNALIQTVSNEEFWTDYGIRDISWYVGNEDANYYELNTDSMIGGLAALVSGMCGIEGYDAVDFAGKTVKVVSTQGDTIDLIEHRWKPIGAQMDYQWFFQGTFDGNDVPIVNMKTKDMHYYNGDLGEGSCQAFFGNIGANAVVTNLNISGRAEGRYFTAGIAAVNYGLIVNSIANVTVWSEFEAGGIVANNFGTVLNSYCVADSIECFSAGAKGTNNYYVGGIAAYNEGKILNCHTVATLVKGNGYNPTYYYGAIVGFNKLENGQPEEGCEVSYCFYANTTYTQACANYNWTNNVAVLAPTTAATLNTNAGVLNVPEVSPVALKGWTTQTGVNYPVFGAVIDRAFMDINAGEFNVLVYPNPTKDMVRIQSENLVSVTVYNMFGQLIMSQEVNGNETEISLNGYAAGVYMVRIVTNEGTAVKNVILE